MICTQHLVPTDHCAVLHNTDPEELLRQEALRSIQEQQEDTLQTDLNTEQCLGHTQLCSRVRQEKREG